MSCRDYALKNDEAKLMFGLFFDLYELLPVYHYDFNWMSPCPKNAQLSIVVNL